jgi:hypothetical protein
MSFFCNKQNDPKIADRRRTEFRDMNEISGFRIVYQEFLVPPDPHGVLGEKISLSAILGRSRYVTTVISRRCRNHQEAHSGGGRSREPTGLVPQGPRVNSEGQTPSDVRFAHCLPFSGATSRPATKGAALPWIPLRAVLRGKPRRTARDFGTFLRLIPCFTRSHWRPRRIKRLLANLGRYAINTGWIGP